MKKEKILKTLKVIGKVLIVAYACIGVICTAILMVGAIKDKMDNDDDNSSQHLNVVATTPVAKNFINIASTQYFLSSSDITWDKLYHGLIYDLGGHWQYEYNQDYVISYVNNLQTNYVNIRYAKWDNDGNVLDIAQWDVYNLTEFSISKDYISPTQCTYTFTFHWERNGYERTQYFYYRVLHNLEVTGASTSGYVNIEQEIFSREEYSGEELPTYYQWTLEFLQADKGYHLVNWLVKDNVGYQEGYSDGYNVGYSSGYQGGYTDGYGIGYDTGAIGMTSNPFNLIKNAFSSISTILNIQVLPNLSLGVLIFAPLVVVIIIAIFKIFRG